ncbi:MAG: hypothetical protein PHT12_04130 [Patescibacteria group bacterium]|nr:hypothetical protein [Patescibacteria group bacterium]
MLSSSLFIRSVFALSILVAGTASAESDERKVIGLTAILPEDTELLNSESLGPLESQVMTPISASTPSLIAVNNLGFYMFAAYDSKDGSPVELCRKVQANIAELPFEGGHKGLIRGATDDKGRVTTAPDGVVYFSAWLPSDSQMMVSCFSMKGSPHITVVGAVIHYDVLLSAESFWSIGTTLKLVIE